MVDFTGYSVYVGLDQHVDSHSYSLFLEDQHSETFHTDRVDAQFIYDKLCDNFPNAKYHLGLEAGYCGYALCRDLQSLGIEVKIVNPADIPTTHKDKVQKRDKRDAKRIAMALQKSQLEGGFVPSSQQEADRDLVRQRIGPIRKAITCAQQRIKAFIVRKGVYDYRDFPGESRNWSKAYIDWLSSMTFDNSSDRNALDLLLLELEHAKQRRRRVDRHLLALSKSDLYRENVELLTSIPGIGRLSAMVLLTEIMDINRFATEDHLRSYLGIIPDVSCSNKKESVSGITVRCNKELRRIIVQCAWVGKNRVPKWSKSYLDLTKRGLVPAQAIMRIARSLVNTVRILLINQERFDPKK